jgi:hypothetical protein
LSAHRPNGTIHAARKCSRREKKTKVLLETRIMKALRLSILLAVCACLGRNAFALSRLGPPASRLDPWQVQIEGEWFHSEYSMNLDFDIDGGMATIAVGVVEHRVDFFGHVGASEADSRSLGESDTALTGGLGGRITTNYDEQLPWGIVVQGMWADYDFDGVTANYADYVIAAGPCWQPGNWFIYGGPMFIWGDVEVGSTEDDEDSVGGYIGGGWEPGENLIFQGEYQRTGDYEAFGLSAAWRF